MGSISSPSIVFSLVLILVLLPSGHASEYRMNKPESTNTPSNDAPAYTQEDFNPVDEAPAYTQDDYNPVDESPVYTPTLPAGKNKPPNGPQQSYGSNSLIALFLAGQNAARAAVGLPPFQWDSNLAAYAQNYANQRINDCQLIHSNGPYGENIFWGSGDTDWSPAQAVDSWVQERQYYDYYSNSCMNGDDCGHYTQIVWRDSTRIGCAKVTCNGGLGQFITCNYDPPGNYIGTRPY